MTSRGAGARPACPPSVVVAVKALACELPTEHGCPLSRLSIAEVRRAVIQRGIVASISDVTVWRWLSHDAIRPWTHRRWIFPRDPDFERKAARVLNLYEGTWNGAPLDPTDGVISADEKTSIQARCRCAPTRRGAPGRPCRVEHAYERRGAVAYVAAWDVRRARVYGRCAPRTSIPVCDGLIEEVMRQEPSHSAPRVFWIMDNGSIHRGQRCVNRLRKRWPNVIAVHLPTHASWLNQVEIYFSIVQRKVLTPNDFNSVSDVDDRLLRFQEHYHAVAKPFEWTFTRDDLKQLLRTLDERQRAQAA